VKEISSKKIGEEVVNSLKELDKVAYVRFASVYREFKDINEFMNEVKALFEHK
jgi:transcriptional repressor NrdR